MNEETITKSFSLLEDIYKEIPPTRGCESASKTCKAYCCKYQTPSMFYCEFLYLWNDFLRNGKKEDILKVITFSVKNFLRNSVTKTCVLFNEEKYNCLCHNSRPFCCRVYAIIHPHNWEKRVEAIKEQNKDIDPEDKKHLSKVLKQCDLVRCLNGKKHISEKEEKKWFEELKNAEISLGVPESIVELMDDPKGSFRTIHDHIVINTFPNEILELLSSQRIDRISEEEIEKLSDEMMASIKNVIGSS